MTNTLRMQNSSDLLTWVDIETTGLVAHADVIVEIGVRVTDLDLNIKGDKHFVLWDSDDPMYSYRWANMDEYVLNMHKSSELWDEVEAMRTGQENAWKGWQATHQIIEFLNDMGTDPKQPMCGSSVHFDRDFMKINMPGLVEACFGYRNIDVSTMKELFLRYDKEAANEMALYTKPQKKHRVMPDIADTIEEFRFYADHLGWL